MSKIFKGDLRRSLGLWTPRLRPRGTDSRSMRQNRNRPTMPSSANASTCGFFTQKGRCARGFQNLPHTSGGRFRKCGENPRSADQTQVMDFRDLRFCCQKSGCARRFPIFSRTSEKRGPASCFLETKKRLPRQHPVVAKPQRAVAGKPNNDPSSSTPHVESTTTISLGIFTATPSTQDSRRCAVYSANWYLTLRPFNWLYGR